MAKVTDTLRAEHVAILKLLGVAQAAGITSPAGLEHLRKSKGLIIAHLEKEERELYPKLKASEGAAHIAGAFSDEMTRLSQTVIGFFEKYHKGATASLEFSKDIGKIVGVLKMRIAREETVLYPAYEKLTG